MLTLSSFDLLYRAEYHQYTTDGDLLYPLFAVGHILLQKMALEHPNKPLTLWTLKDDQ